MRLTVALMAFVALVAACTASEPEAERAATPAAEGQPGAATERSATSAAPTPMTLPVRDGLEEGRLKVYITGRSVAGLGPSTFQPHADDAQLQLLIDQTPGFTEQTGIPIEYIFLRASRELLTRDCATDCSIDVVLLDVHEIPQYGSHFGWALPLDELAASDPGWAVDDLVPSVRTALSADGSLYGAPLTSNSSFLVYRTDLLADAGLSITAEPTWEEVSEIARALTSADNGTRGICLQSEPSWDSAGAVFTSMLNTFGGTYWTATPDGDIGVSQVDQPEFREAFAFYIDLLLDAGPVEPLDLGFRECLELYQAGEVAMWLDSTAAGPLLEVDDSPVQGLNGYAQTPTVQTESASWLEGRGFSIFANAAVAELSWEYIQWATSPGILDGFAVDPEARAGFGMTWQPFLNDPSLRSAYGSSLDVAIEAALGAPLENPGTTPRPGLPAVQYVGVAEFQDVASRCMDQLAEVLSGLETVDGAVDACHTFASEVT